MKPLNVKNKKFGRLLVISESGRDKTGAIIWKCQCDCGNTAFVRGYCFLRKKSPTRSCGCFAIETARTKQLTHGMSRTKEFKAWGSMQERCYNIKNKSYDDYGGRGIEVCDEWRGPHGFMNFLDHIGPSPTKYHSVDRIDVNKDYEPGNVRWATAKQQIRKYQS